MSSVFVVNSFTDLKLKSSGGGGFSDGGIVSNSVSAKAAGGSPVTREIAPPKGVNFGGVMLDAPPDQDEPGGVTVMNFDATNPVDVEEYFVSADGTETLIDTTTIGPLAYDNVTDFFENGGILSYPNKLRYKLVQSTVESELQPMPAGRVLLKTALMLYDRPSDQG